MVERKELVPAKFDVNTKWDAFLNLTIRRVVYTSATGAFGGLLLFRSPVSRWAYVAFGFGLGVGSAYIDYKHIFGGSPAKLETPTSASDAKSTPPTTFSDTYVHLAPCTAVPDAPALQRYRSFQSSLTNKFANMFGSHLKPYRIFLGYV